jgi:hypothetical protein
MAKSRAMAYIPDTEGASMTRIEIKDLPQSDELDRAAMLAVVGGARSGSRKRPVGEAQTGLVRLVDYPPGFSRESSMAELGNKRRP